MGVINSDNASCGKNAARRVILINDGKSKAWKRRKKKNWILNEGRYDCFEYRPGAVVHDPNVAGLRLKADSDSGETFVSDTSEEELPSRSISTRQPATEDCVCFYCNGKYSEGERGEEWVQCFICEGRVHSECAAYDFGCYNVSSFRMNRDFAFDRATGEAFLDSDLSFTSYRDYSYAFSDLLSVYWALAYSYMSNNIATWGLASQNKRIFIAQKKIV
nr:unnamed protein product [Callosobruchus analis]